MKSFTDRFYAKFKQQHDHECWVWLANKNNKGYGMIHHGPSRRKILAHRASYEIHTGPIPALSHVLHKCDNPPCVNPAHLFLGSHGDNMRDKESKGRGNHPSLQGESNPASLVTDDDVINIRRLFDSGMTRQQLSDSTPLTYAAIADIVLGRSWAHLPLCKTKRNDATAKLNKDDVLAIKKLITSGMQGKDIAARYGVHKTTISDIKTGKTWASI